MKNYLFFISVFPLSNGIVLADSSLNLAPAKCVTLNQGNTCYQELKVTWQADSKGHYCLLNSVKEAPVNCWFNVNKGSYNFEFSGVQSVDYQLVKMPIKAPVAQQHFSVKWVYKARPNNRWRLF